MPKFETPEPISVTLDYAVGNVRISASDRTDTVVEVRPSDDPRSTFYNADGFLRSVAAQFGVDAPVWGFSVTAIVIGLVWTHLPFATLMVVSGVQGVPDALIEAARDAGANLFRTVLRVVAPLALVPTVIAATFTAIGTLGSFTVPYFTGPNAPKMLGVDMADYFQAFNLPQAAVVMAVVVFVVASGFGAVYVWANYRAAAQTGRV